MSFKELLVVLGVLVLFALLWLFRLLLGLLDAFWASIFDPPPIEPHERAGHVELAAGHDLATFADDS